ncbi:unnamed protein product, partial [Ectocarpus sp. 8 AP-2014]
MFCLVTIGSILLLILGPHGGTIPTYPRFFLVSTRANRGPFAPHPPPPGGDNQGTKSQTD